MNRKDKFCRMVHLRTTDPSCEELKILEIEMSLTSMDIKNKLSEIHKKQITLTRQHEDLQMEAINLISICPHESCRPYRACGVETAICDYCGHEKFVRGY